MARRTGTSANNRFEGGAGSDRFTGAAGNDTLIGGGGGDILDGGADDDRIEGGAGGDRLTGGTGDDTLVGGSGHDRIIGDVENSTLPGGHDSIEGGVGADYVDAGKGNDTVRGGEGADTLIGGLGRDLLSYYGGDPPAGVSISLAAATASGGDAQGDVISGFEDLDGTDHADTLVGDRNGNSINGYKGADSIDGGAGADSIRGGEGNDTIRGGEGADTLDGQSGEDTVVYSGSNAAVDVDLSASEGSRASGGHAEGDRLSGFSHVVGSAHADLIAGDTGDNRIEGGAGGDWLAGDTGRDVLLYEGSDAGVYVNLHTDSLTGGHATGDTVSGFEDVVGSDHADTLVGDAAGNVIEGGKGADSLDGGGGIDTLDYGASDAGVRVNLETRAVSGGHAQGDSIARFEHVIGSDYSDTLYGDAGPNTLGGGVGSDLLVGGAGADSLSGGWGWDHVYYLNSSQAVSVNLASGRGAGGDAEGDTLVGIEAILGSAHGDTIVGDSGSNAIVGMAGADNLDGGKGWDWLAYANSDASVNVNLTENRASGGHATNDTIAGFEHLGGSGHADTLIGDAGYNQIAGDGGADFLDGRGGWDELIYGSSDGGVAVDLANNTASGGHAEGDTIRGFESIRGSAYADTLTGNGEGNYLRGEAGADRISGGGGNDGIHGGAGADTLDGGAGEKDTVLYRYSDAGVYVNLATGLGSGGHAEGDVLSNFERVIGSDYDDTLIGSAGNDSILGEGGADSLDGGGGRGDWLLYGLSGASVYVNLDTGVVYGGDAEGDRIAGFEYMKGSSYNDTLLGDRQDNLIHGREGDDRIEGKGGNDTIVGGPGADHLDGGAGTGDLASYASSGEGVSINLENGTARGGRAEGDTLIGFEHLTGSPHDDTLIGDAAANRIEGGEGADRIAGGEGADTLAGGEGEDTLDYAGSDAAVAVDLSTSVVSGGHAAGDRVSGFEHAEGSGYADTLTGGASGNTLRGGKGADRIDGGHGNDRIEGGEGADTLGGGQGQDTLDYGGSDAAVSVDLSTRAASGGHAAGDSFTGFEHVVGSGQADTLVGDAAANVLHGGAGTDSIEGGGGTDTIQGGEGADSIEGGSGADSLSGGGGTGTDTLVYAGSNAAVSVNLLAGTASGGHAGGDTISGFEHLRGSRFDDSLTGDGGNNRIDGGAGGDTLTGGGGRDTLDYSRSDAAVSVDLSDNSASGGHATRDVISGFEDVVGSGHHGTLAGGAGGSRLTGGAGNDRFVFSAGGSENTITDFEDGDVIEFTSSHGVGAYNEIQISAHNGGSLLKFTNVQGSIFLAEVDTGTVNETDFIF